MNDQKPREFFIVADGLEELWDYYNEKSDAEKRLEFIKKKFPTNPTFRILHFIEYSAYHNMRTAKLSRDMFCDQIEKDAKREVSWLNDQLQTERAKNQRLVEALKFELEICSCNPSLEYVCNGHQVVAANEEKP